MCDLSANWNNSYRELEQRIISMEQKLDELTRCFQQTSELLAQALHHRHPEIRWHVAYRVSLRLEKDITLLSLVCTGLSFPWDWDGNPHLPKLHLTFVCCCPVWKVAITMRQSDPVLNGLHRDLYEDEKGRFFFTTTGWQSCFYQLYWWFLWTWHCPIRISIKDYHQCSVTMPWTCCCVVMHATCSVPFHTSSLLYYHRRFPYTLFLWNERL